MNLHHAASEKNHRFDAYDKRARAGVERSALYSRAYRRRLR
jgi:hypothetical protein